MKKIILSILVFLIVILLNAQQTSIMSFNIRYDNPNDKENWWENRKTDVVNLIENYHPDIVGIQEGLHHQVEYIQDHTTNYAYIGVGRDDGKTKGEYSALYFDTTKFILIKQQTFWLSETPEDVSVGWDASMERICTFGMFRTKCNQDTICIFNTHFDHIGPISRKNSAILILDLIKKWGLIDQPIVLMGDLNAEPESKPIQLIMKSLHEGCQFVGYGILGPKGTFNGFNTETDPQKRIDYIFTKNLKLSTYRHVDDKRDNLLWVSDHLPVLVHIEF